MSEQLATAAKAEAPAAPFAVCGIWTAAPALYHACEKLRDAGYTRFDAHTPFPVHGLERAMGLKPSKIPWVALSGGLFGLGGMIALAYYSQAVWYPLNIGGKEAFSYQAFVPLFFEMTVLFSALFIFFGLWALNKQPQFFHPVMQHKSWPRITDDAFMIAVETSDPKYDAAATRKLFEELGAEDIEEVMP